MYTQELIGLNIPWINNWLASIGINGNGSLSGMYYQLLSQLPGQGPCYPVWVPTTDIKNECVPVWPDNFTSSVIQFVGKGISLLPAEAADSFKVTVIFHSKRYIEFVAIRVAHPKGYSITGRY